MRSLQMWVAVFVAGCAFWALLILVGSDCAEGASYRPDTVITESYQGEGAQYVVWFTAGNINSPNYAIEFECRVDRGEWYPCGLNQAVTGLPTVEYLYGLDPGRHVFEVRTLFRDAFDNTPDRVRFTLG